MQRLIHDIAEATTVVAHFENFPSVTTVRALRECDVIVSCVDRLQVRDDINRLSKRYLIPLIDVGLEVMPGDATAMTVTAISGRVTKVQPDGACPRCQG